MVPAYVKPFQYTVPWRSSSVHLGDHQGTERGLGFEYRGNVPLLDYPDARRMDLRQTVRDPYEQIHIRLFNQDTTTPVFAVCDLSSSMQFRGRHDKLEELMKVAASIAYSVHEAGDLFGLVSYHHNVVEDFSLPLGPHMQQAFEVIENLRHYQDTGRNGDGILQVPQYLSQRRGLVFWISDFHMPLTLIERAMNMMSAHQVVPIVLWDEQEYSHLPAFGFGTMIDPETGANRTVFFRAALTEKFRIAFAARKQALYELFAKYENPALFVANGYEAEALTHYFEQYMSL